MMIAPDVLRLLRRRVEKAALEVFGRQQSVGRPHFCSPMLGPTA